MVSQRLNDGFALQGDSLLQTDVFRRGANFHDKLSRDDIPLTVVLMTIVAELLGIEFCLHGFGLSWLERYTDKALQLDRTDLLTGVCG